MDDKFYKRNLNDETGTDARIKTVPVKWKN